jgi:uncharacterized protein
MVQPVDDGAEGDDAPAVQSIGCAGRITSYAETDDGRLLIVLTGIARFQIVAENESFRPLSRGRGRLHALCRRSDRGAGRGRRRPPVLIETLRSYLEARQLVADWDEVEAASTEALVNSLSALSPYPAGDKQALLEAADLKARADMLIALTEVALARAEGSDGPRLQ